VTYPGRNEEIDMTGKRSLELSWNASRDSQAYRLSIEDSENGEILYSSETEGSTYLIQDLSSLKEGSFLLNIQGFKKYPDLGIEQQTRTESVPFSLKLNIPARTLEIISDGTQYTN
ncbi:MAG: hypothetical protein PQJ50_10735, partial [Spirochaetales bacterium]|nr:hypothetical protein [Spirochaetales bacterium]